MSCPGIPSNQPPGDPFPINTNDPSRRRLHRAWPADASSSAFSRRVELVAGERYWMQLECQMSGVSHDPPSAPPPVQPPAPPSPPPPPPTLAFSGKPGSSTVYQPSCAVGARCAGGRASARST